MWNQLRLGLDYSLMVYDYVKAALRVVRNSESRNPADPRGPRQDPIKILLNNRFRLRTVRD
jgi:hypothetical protein